MQLAKRVSQRQRDELRELDLPDLGNYLLNLGTIHFVNRGSALFAPSVDKRKKIFLTGYRQWHGKNVADQFHIRGTVQRIRVRGVGALTDSGIKPSDHANIFEVYVVWKNGSRPASWIGVQKLKALS